MTTRDCKKCGRIIPKNERTDRHMKRCHPPARIEQGEEYVKVPEGYPVVVIDTTDGETMDMYRILDPDLRLTWTARRYLRNPAKAEVEVTIDPPF